MIVLINLSALLDDAKCFELVRQTRWLQGFRCPKCPICRVNIEILMNGLISSANHGSLRQDRGT